MFKVILVPVDGSPTSDEAVALAISLARDQHAQLVFCHALEEIALIHAAATPSIDPTFAIQEARDYSSNVLQAAETRAKAAGVEASSESAEEDAIPMILRLAAEKHADLIVIGTHGRGGFKRALMGSTTEGLLRGSSVPVLAIRHKDARR
jgi:nucleotide-binding universal stress UspA family protein